MRTIKNRITAPRMIWSRRLSDILAVNKIYIRIPTISNPETKKKAPAVQFSKGEMVQHKAFGRGMVLTVLPMGNDALLEIAFDGIGTKRLMANTASQHMTKL